MARAFFAAYRISHAGEDMPDAGPRGPYVDVTAFSLPKGVDWKMLFDTYRYWNHFSRALYQWPHHLKRYFIIPSIHVSSLSSLAELFPNENGSEAMPYFRKNICARYKSALSSRDMVEISKYFQFEFCAELNQGLIKLYRETKDTAIMRYGIGNLRLKENYDFFMKELSSPDPDTKRKAAGGLVLSDAKRACATMAKMNESERRIIANQLIIGCGDKNEMWNAIIHQDLYPYTSVNISMGHLSGSSISKEQLAVLRGMEGTAPPNVKIILARLFFEAGDRGIALSTMRNAVQGILAEGIRENLFFEEFEGMVAEFIPILSPLFPIDRYSVSIAKGLDGVVPYPSYPPELIASLRRIYKNDKEPADTRLEAAFLLLKSGYPFE
jgi:hypothetical protein